MSDSFYSEKLCLQILNNLQSQKTAMLNIAVQWLLSD